MAKDNKKEKPQKEPKVDTKDKDIHLNLVGVPKKNVNVKKTYPRQNNEDFQLYRISIDTKGKDKDRKHRVGSLEPSPKKTTNRKRFRNDADDVVSSDDSYTDVSRAPKSRTTGGLRAKQPTPTPRRKSDDSEICITIPGEKGKAIRIVGSSTKPHDEASRVTLLQRSKGNRSESPRQVGFAKLDEVYGTTPEGTSLESRSSLPYRKHSPQVYKLENSSPTSVFKDPTTSKYASERSIGRPYDKTHDNSPTTKSTSDPNSTLEERSKQSSQQAEKSGGPHVGSFTPKVDYPSTSKGTQEEQTEFSQSKQSGYSMLHPVNKSVDGTSSNVPTSSHATSNYDPGTGTSTETRGKYPFYPYDKQKRSKSPPKLFQDSNEQDVEPYTSQKLPSIPEVRSTENYPTAAVGVHVPPMESSVVTRPTTRSNEAHTSPSPLSLRTNQNNLPIYQLSSNHLIKQDQRNTQGNKQIFNDPPKPSKVENPVNSTLSNIQRDTLGNNSALYSTPKLNQPHEPPQQISQSTSPMTPKLHKKVDIPVVASNFQNNQSRLETPRTDYRPELQNTQSMRASPSSLKESSQSKLRAVESPRESMFKKDQVTAYNRTDYRPELQNTQSMRASPSSLKESLQSKLRAVESPRESMFKKDQVVAYNRTPVAVKQPEVADKQIMTDKVLKPKERILLEINEELNKKNSPIHQTSLQGSTKTNVSSNEKDPKKKSKLSNFVSSIPKPLFRRNKSLEKKGTDKSVVADETQPKVSSQEQTPNAAKEQFNTNDEARKPVEESAILKQTHEPVVEAYPSWVSSPIRLKPETRGDDFQSQRFKEDPLIEKNENKDYSKEFLPHRTDESSSVEIANRSYDDHPITRKSSRAPTASEEIKRSSVADEEQDHLKEGADSGVESWKPQVTERNRNQLEDDHDNASTQNGLESIQEPDYYNYNKSKMPFEGVDVMAFPGKTFEQTPFGYESQFKADQQDENQELLSLEDAYEANKKSKKDKPYSSTHLADRKPSLVSAPMTPEGELKNTLYEQPIQGLRVSIGSQPILEKRSPKEVSYDPNQKVRSKDRVYEHEAKADKSSPVSQKRASRLSHTPNSIDSDDAKAKPVYRQPIQVLRGSTGLQPIPEKRYPREVSYDPNRRVESKDRMHEHDLRADNNSPVRHRPTSLDGNDVKIQSLNENPFGRTTEEQVYIEHAPPITYTVFNPGDSIDELSLNKVETKQPTNQWKGPKGILIFVNKKNETTSPFDKGTSPPKKEDNSKKSKPPSGTKKGEKNKKDSSGDTSASTSVQSNNFASGDKKVVIERSPSGRKLTQKFPCGCIRIITSDPKKKVNREELITAFCEDGSRCEVGKSTLARSTSQLGRSKGAEGENSLPSSVSWESSRAGGRSDTSDRLRDTFPDIEVIADGVVSRNPIKPRTPAPTMNGAKLTGSFKIRSNKVNGVCNLYLDRKLKHYLRNNMDKVKELLEDDRRS